MKKKISLAFLLTLINFQVFATPVNSSIAYCADLFIYQNESMPIHSIHYWNVKNDTQVDQHAQVMYQLCLPDQPCIKKIYPDVILDASKIHVSDIDEIYSHIKINKKGTYYYKVITDVGGYLLLHDEKVCKLTVIE